MVAISWLMPAGLKEYLNSFPGQTEIGADADGGVVGLGVGVWDGSGTGLLEFAAGEVGLPPWVRVDLDAV